MQFIKPDVNINFVGFRKFALILSVLLVVASLALIFVKGFNYGIEFAGGVEVRVKVAPDIKAAAIQKALAKRGITKVTVHEFVDLNNVFSIKIKGDQIDLDGKGKLSDKAGELIDDLEQEFGKGNIESISADMIGPRVGKTLRKKGVSAILFAMIGILIYIGFRFNFRYAPGSVVALAHDVIITCGVLVLLDREISLTVIAALLTISGYSINDTIIVFDRIREGMGVARGRSLPEIVNTSINQTLSRTILTSVTTMLVVLSLFFLGGEILRDFSLSMIVGIIVGTYSSIFVASPIFLLLEETFLKRKKTQRRRRR